jgi:hypothetical protein
MISTMIFLVSFLSILPLVDANKVPDLGDCRNDYTKIAFEIHKKKLTRF